jgi:circadian clock protein KaiC
MTTITNNTKEKVIDKIINFEESLIKAPTGIKGFDEITFGGIPRNRPTLVVGGIGSGKTFFSMQFILKGITDFNEPGVFMTFEEKANELLTNVSNLGYDLKKLMVDNKIYLEHLQIGQYEMQESGKYNIDGLFVRIEEAIKRTGAKRIVFDSLDSLFSNLDTTLLKSEFKRLFFWLKEKNVTAVITAESGFTYITRLGLEENVADCVIELSNRIVNQIATRRLRILKYRGSNHANNEYPFIIDKNGLFVYPIISQSMDQIVSSERISSGILTLDEMLENKGFFIGSSILISGTAGTGKTSFTSTFLQSLSNADKKTIYCAFEESPNQINRNMKSIGIDIKKINDTGNLLFYYARPTIQNLELHFMAIQEKIEKFNPSVVILDPITNLMTEGPNSDVRDILTKFIDHVKTKKITIMLTGAITLGSISRVPSDEGISSMVDTWVMIDDVEIEYERIRFVYVMKSRGMNHSKEVRELKISSEGISLLPISRNEKGIIVGSKRMKETPLLVSQNNSSTNHKI